MRTTDRLRPFLAAFFAGFVLLCIQPQSARSADPPLIILTDSAAEHLLGTVGDSKRLDVTVISDVVNVASRLESLTKEKGEPILVSGEIVASLVSLGRFSLKKIGSTTIRGRVQPVDVWAARDFSDTTT